MSTVAERLRLLVTIRSALSQVAVELGGPAQFGPLAPSALIRSGHMVGGRPISRIEHDAETALLAAVDQISRETGLSFHVISSLFGNVEIKRGRTWGTVVIRALSGPDLYRQAHPTLTDPAQAVMIAFFENDHPARFDDCLGAGVLNLGTREMIIAGLGHKLAMRWYARMDVRPLPRLTSDTQIVYCTDDDKITRAGLDRLDPDRENPDRTTLPDFYVVNFVPSVGVRFLNMAAGYGSAAVGWAGNGEAADTIIGICLTLMAGGVVLDSTGADFSFRTLDSVLVEGTGYIAAATLELAKQLSDRLGTAV